MSHPMAGDVNGRSGDKSKPLSLWYCEGQIVKTVPFATSYSFLLVFSSVLWGEQLSSLISDPPNALPITGNNSWDGQKGS